MRLFAAVAIMGMFVFTDAMAQKIIWVSGNYDADSNGVQNDQPFIDVLLGNGYEVQQEIDSMKGSPLTAEQLTVLESGDLIIFSRATGSGDYIDPAGWNGISKPLILNNVWAARLNRWQWANTDALLGDGNSGCPWFYAEIPEHPIFADVTLNQDGTVAVLDSTVGTGHTSLLNTMDCGDGELIATSTLTVAEAIVYWPKDAFFNSSGTYVAGGPRMLFSCQTREGGTFGIGMYNLTPVGEQIYLNAVAFMLGQGTGVSEKPGELPAGYTLEQNYPNPFNPWTRIAFTLSSTSMTKISVYNMLGQEIAVLAERTFQAGRHEVVWNGCDRFGNPMPSGVYMYQMKTGDRAQSRKMILIK